jgi:hypothetical protein
MARMWGLLKSHNSLSKERPPGPEVVSTFILASTHPTLKKYRWSWERSSLSLRHIQWVPNCGSQIDHCPSLEGYGRGRRYVPENLYFRWWSPDLRPSER